MKVQSNLEQSDEKPAGVTEVISELRGDLEEQRLPAERDRESLEGCLRVTEWWSNSRSCHRMSEDAAETGSEEVRRWAVKRTGHEGVEIVASGVLIPLLGSGAKIGRMQSRAHAIRGKYPQGKCSGVAGSEMDGAVMEQYWRRSGGLEVREVRRRLPGVRMHWVISEMIPEVTSETKVIIEDVEMTLISGLGGRQKMTSGLAFHLQESGEVAARNLIGSTDRIEGMASGPNNNMHLESNEG
ncbi:hypothetical protein L210DRAFT_3499226 [Boletus edulis BED1]|uniref:Uncharacterized protein n=1 Tax=Boletus edulis BED1 TaxID=1328754 RepID=A0AAD4GL99_BOLED|nr:hypothetical protein L210DRAFT_3499226 [Boletus edulis BED1]